MHGGSLDECVMTQTADLLTEDNNSKFIEIIDTYQLIAIQLIDIFKSLNEKEENFYRELNPRIIDNLIHESRYFSDNLFKFIRLEENKKYLFLSVGGNTLINRLERLFLVFSRHDEIIMSERNRVMRIDNNLHSFFSWFKIYEDLVSKQKESDKLVSELTSSVNQAKNQAKNLETAIQAINGQEAEIIYSSASIKFVDSARKYEVLFYLILGGAILFTTVHLCYVPFKSNEVNFILVKILTFSLVLTLGTIFLRKAAHLRKLSDQAQQTSLELKALPLYLKNVDTEHHSEIYKELTGKYFGKDVDQTQNDKIGDLMKDQLAAGTELIKASAEIVKIGKPSVEK